MRDEARDADVTAECRGLSGRSRKVARLDVPLRDGRVRVRKRRQCCGL